MTRDVRAWLHVHVVEAKPCSAPPAPQGSLREAGQGSSRTVWRNRSQSLLTLAVCTPQVAKARLCGAQEPVTPAAHGSGSAGTRDFKAFRKQWRSPAGPEAPRRPPAMLLCGSDAAVDGDAFLKCAAAAPLRDVLRFLACRLQWAQQTCRSSHTGYVCVQFDAFRLSA